jgi:hypothetical protein
MTDDLLPWDVNPDLTFERLRVLAKNVRDVRHDALDVHEEEKGDDAQVHGTIAYRRCCYRLMELAKSGEHPWLSIPDKSRRFIFAVGGTSMRMYRGDARRPPARSLRSYVTELIAQQQGDLPFDEKIVVPRDGWVWRMAVETDVNGHVVRIVVFQANPDLEVRNLYEVPLHDSVAEISSVSPLTRAGKEIPPAQIGKKKDSATQDSAAAEGGTVLPFRKDPPKGGEEV